MFALLLVACGTEVGGGGVLEPDVSLSPVQLSKSWPYQTLLDGGDTLAEAYGSVFVVNDGADPMDLEVLATIPPGGPYLDEGPDSWLDVSIKDDLAFPMAPGQQVELVYWAWGVVKNGDELPRGLYPFDLIVTVGGVDKIVGADVILETAD